MSIRLRYCLYLNKRLESAERLVKNIQKRLSRNLLKLDEADTFLFGYQAGYIDEEDYERFLKEIKKWL